MKTGRVIDYCPGSRRRPVEQVDLFKGRCKVCGRIYGLNRHGGVYTHEKRQERKEQEGQ